ncbi:efflux RND transporter permease subunit [Chitinophaga agri]|uniref:Efflux RND transporter permease subunit n=1 Tax=Chitinophaga agri TaxID=2703787 RepID=A0A6B9ZM65_9BACT|nr:efflux RND transporter permease subunit [Chitinophaga agri]QHS63530.1 efflux RND transporter permease subunit [Chitinophaga agri]
MIGYFINRPVAILVLFAALMAFGLVLIFQVPVSLLPAIDVPRMIVKVNFPNASARQVEDQVLKPIREQLSLVDDLTGLHSEASNHLGTVYLDFDYRANMSLAYIEVNEKMDRLLGRLPPDMPRPQVVRINTSDIPVVRIQVVPVSDATYQEVSDLTEKVLKRRLEQLPGVSVVDMNGQRGTVAILKPDRDRMNAFGITTSALLEAVRLSNMEIGGLNLKDGQYQYFIRLENQVRTVSDLGNVSVKGLSGQPVQLKEIASVEMDTDQLTGYHLYNGKPGVVVTVQAQAKSRMNELLPMIRSLVSAFQKQYPQARFNISQDQSFLLDAGIDNVKQDIILGGALTIGLLFLFLGNWASPVLMSISIPISLLITFIFFQLFGLSFNIISLSGLALGIGMLIDNSIVVIGEITRKRIAGLSVTDSAIRGTNEMAVPVISQVLTTVVVYAPLVILNGLSGALVMDQSIALTISLFVSLLVAFVLTPVLYKLLLKSPPERLKQDTVFYTFVRNRYHSMISFVLLKRKLFFAITLLVIALGVGLAFFIPFESLPAIEKKESLIKISWNEPLDLQENKARSLALIAKLSPVVAVSESDVGATQYIFQQDGTTIYQANVYYECASEKEKLLADRMVKQQLVRYPKCTFNILDAPNAFTQLFVNDEPYVRVKFKPLVKGGSAQNLDILTDWLKVNRVQYAPEPSMMREPAMRGVLDMEAMNRYQINRAEIDQQLQVLFGSAEAGAVDATGDKTRVLVTEASGSVEEKLDAVVRNSEGIAYPIRKFIRFEPVLQFSAISADKDGTYRSIALSEQPDIKAILNEITAEARSLGYDVDFTGKYFENRQLMRQLSLIFLIVLVMLYTVLAIQFESFVQPVIVMLTIPLGVAGACLLLLITGGTFNVMSAIGFVVVLGLIVDDPLLKIETLNKLADQYRKAGREYDETLLHQMIHEAGEICLKPLLMVSLTTSIALLPILFIGGIGNDLQRPMAIVIIGGLTIGTFFTTWFIPLAYWYIQKWTGKI